MVSAEVRPARMPSHWSSLFFVHDSSAHDSSTLFFQNFKSHPSHPTRVNSSLNIGYRKFFAADPFCHNQSFSQCWHHLWRCAPSQLFGLQTFSVVALATTSSTVRPELPGGLDFPLRSKKTRPQGQSSDRTSQSHEYTAADQSQQHHQQTTAVRSAMHVYI